MTSSGAVSSSSDKKRGDDPWTEEQHKLQGMSLMSKIAQVPGNNKCADCGKAGDYS